MHAFASIHGHALDTSGSPAPATPAGVRSGGCAHHRTRRGRRDGHLQSAVPAAPQAAALPGLRPARLRVEQLSPYGAATGGRFMPDYLDRIQQAPSIEAATLVTQRTLNLGVADRPEQLRALAVTPSFFETLGRAPELGRSFVPKPRRNPGRTALSSSPWAVAIALCCKPRGDRSGHPAQRRARTESSGSCPGTSNCRRWTSHYWSPSRSRRTRRSDQERGREFSQMIARLAPGASIAGAERR